MANSPDKYRNCLFKVYLPIILKTLRGWMMNQMKKNERSKIYKHFSEIDEDDSKLIGQCHPCNNSSLARHFFPTRLDWIFLTRLDCWLDSNTKNQSSQNLGVNVIFSLKTIFDASSTRRQRGAIKLCLCVNFALNSPYNFY